MKKNSELNDNFLKEMFKLSTLDAPSSDITSKIIDRIHNTLNKRKNMDESVIDPKYWLFVGIGLAISAYVLFQQNWTFMKNIFRDINIVNIEIHQITTNIFSSLYNFITSIQIPFLLIIIILTVILLLSFDKILKQRLNKIFFLYF